MHLVLEKGMPLRAYINEYRANGYRDLFPSVRSVKSIDVDPYDEHGYRRNRVYCAVDECSTFISAHTTRDGAQAVNRFVMPVDICA